MVFKTTLENTQKLLSTRGYIGLRHEYTHRVTWNGEVRQALLHTVFIIDQFCDFEQLLNSS